MAQEVLNERVLKTEYSELMQKSYIDYAMSVIVSRALPDVRDGLKPVQRRVLYDMYELGVRYDRPHRKSARIVGDTMGKYHPHGDSSIYDALVVMTQDFKKGIPLVDGHGNFGNIEGDGAAAMRYTEARLARISQEGILADLDKDVVDFMPNFDETEKEPTVLPARFPNLLVNGSEGIAVGMATKIPPHNTGEVIDATIAYIRNEGITTAELMKYVKGPDFPTGGIVINKDELESIYESGSGKIKLRGRIEVEQGKGGRLLLVIKEIPYTMIGQGIARFLQDVAALAESRKTTDVVDISNQSSKEGIRIVIELKKDTDVENFTNMLYKKTRLEDSFGVNMLAIADGRPETMGLKEILKHNVAFQFELNRRKYTNLLAKEREKKEVQEGLIKACNVIDLIIEILRGSKDRPQAKACLVEGITDGIQFKSKQSQIMAGMLHFTERQADAILELRLYRLIGLEIEALKREYEETTANIYRYEDILDRRESMATVIINDLQALKKTYAVERKTSIENAEDAVYEEKKVEEMDVIFLMDRFGYCKTIDPATLERNREAVESENAWIVECKNTGKLCAFSDKGNLHTLRVSDLPHGRFRDKGVPLDNVSAFDSQQERIINVISQEGISLLRLLFVTKQGMLKYVNGDEFDVAKRMVAATKLADGDELVAAEILYDQSWLAMFTHNGMLLKMDAEEVPLKKKAAVGVRGIKLSKGDYVEMAVVGSAHSERHLVEFNDKKIDLALIRSQKRDAKGTRLK
ncbi:MAG: DNA topoisomerase 4 subunit A [Lachnospiraceae bacterium]|nr:DNA topoisomerase 4 subunit A [Lachnospiraceae bacterium]